MSSHNFILKLNWNSASVWSRGPGRSGGGCVGVCGLSLTLDEYTTGRM